jgi:sulfide dehydrogenase [flavocytochrome c] flavoprotein subunit
MDARRRTTRRTFVRGLAAGAASWSLARPSIAQAKTSIVVVGGGFGGTACARALQRHGNRLEVTLIETDKTYTACPFSNEVIAGLREIGAQQFSYDRLAADGIRVITQAATAIDAHAHRVTLADGSTLAYDRLVMSPGIDLNFKALDGYDEAASMQMPHAWKAGDQTMLLRRQLEAMDDGGTVVIAVPANPARCPPAPYERASLVAHYLKANKPRSKVLILDAKDGFSQQRLFENAWKELYPGMIERIALSQGGRVTGVDVATKTVITEFGNYTADVANVIPPQTAGRIATLAGAADHTGWCPIDSVTFASKLMPDIHVIGDACLGGGIPKSASAANEQGKACAAVILAQLGALKPLARTLIGVCYSTVAPDYAFSLSGVYQSKGDIFAEVEGGATSAVDAPLEERKRKAEKARTWFTEITADSFG